MKRMIIGCFIASLVNTAWAGMVDMPSVNNNVTVMKNISASQCKSSWNGRINPDMMTGVSRFGTDTVEAVGVQSCTGCSFDQRTNSCICKTCYGYFN